MYNMRLGVVHLTDLTCTDVIYIAGYLLFFYQASEFDLASSDLVRNIV